jgi:riboflavin kinase/FMN adenylyltransferase
MKLIRDLHNLNALHRPAVVSIGNYDGVHLGHCRLIHALKKKAKALGAQMTVLTFEPHPHEFFSPKNAPPRLMNWREKMDALCQQGVDQAMTLRFNDRLSQTSAEDFVENLLVGGLGAQHIVIGDDFRFGRKRLGDVALLTRLGRRFGFTVDTIDTCIVEGERVSSTRIRSACWVIHLRCRVGYRMAISAGGRSDSRQRTSSLGMRIFRFGASMRFG